MSLVVHIYLCSYYTILIDAGKRNLAGVCRFKLHSASGNESVLQASMVVPEGRTTTSANRTPRKSPKRCVLGLNFAYPDFFFSKSIRIPGDTSKFWVVIRSMTYTSKKKFKFPLNILKTTVRLLEEMHTNV